MWEDGVGRGVVERRVRDGDKVRRRRRRREGLTLNESAVGS